MMLRRAGLGLLVGAILMAPSVASAAPALVFEPYNGTVLYAEDPDAQWFPASLTTAQHLGMTRTHFTNVNGLPDERQVTTARDLAKLALAIIVEFPEHADLFSSMQVQVGKKTMRTHNSLLLSFPGADGMKTGFICESGFNVVASATRDGRKLVAVVLGEPSVASRNDRATDLLDKGFRRYFWKSLFGTRLDGLAIQ